MPRAALECDLLQTTHRRITGTATPAAVFLRGTRVAALCAACFLAPALKADRAYEGGTEAAGLGRAAMVSGEDVLPMSAIPPSPGTAATVAAASAALAAAGDAVLAFCQQLPVGPGRPEAMPGVVAGARCACSLQGLETLVGAETWSGFLRDLRQVGAVSDAEFAAYRQDRDAACAATLPAAQPAQASGGRLP